MDKPVTPTGAPPLLTVRATPLAPGLDPRSSAVLREIVEQYVETGEPVGSRTLSRRLPLNVSPATIRNVMADLTDAGLLYAPHTSAGRLLTERGLCGPQSCMGGSPAHGACAGPICGVRTGLAMP